MIQDNKLIKIILIALVGLLTTLTILITPEIFSHAGIYTALGFIAVLVGALGVVSFALTLSSSKAQRTIIKIFTIYGMLFSILYSVIGVDIKIMFYVAFLLFLALFVLNLIFTKKHKPREIVSDKLPKGKYIRFTLLTRIYVLVFIAIIAIVWFIPMESWLGIYETPNGGGSATYSDNKFSVEIDGGFIYHIEYENENKVNLFVRMSAPSTDVSMSSMADIDVDVDLVNYYDGLSVTTGTELLSIHTGSNILDYSNFTNSDEMLSDIQRGKYFEIVKTNYVSIDVSENDPVTISITGEADSDEEFTFYAISDTHSGYDVFLPLVKDIANTDPDFVVFNGDIVNEGYSIEYNTANAIFRSTPFPVYTLIGNHDAWNRGDNEYYKYFGAYFYSFVYKNTKFIFLDTSSGVIGEAQFAWLESELKSNESENKIVMTHIPPYDFSVAQYEEDLRFINPELRKGLFSSSEAYRLVDMLEEYNVSAFLAGHTHQHSYMKSGGVQYATSGVIGGHAATDDDIGYLKIDVVGSAIYIEFIDASQYYSSDTFFAKLLQTIKVFGVPFFVSKCIRVALSLLTLALFVGIKEIAKSKYIYISK